MDLYAACRAVFSRSETNPWTERPLNLDTIKDVHRLCTASLLGKAAGELRTIAVGSTGITYPVARKVPGMLNALVDFVGMRLTEVKPVGDSLEFRLKLGAFFFGQFLYVHPFVDGNGRTARILFSHLLRHHSVVPLCLYLRICPGGIAPRELYLTSLRNSQGDGAQAFTLVRYVYECVRCSLNDISELVLE